MGFGTLFGALLITTMPERHIYTLQNINEAVKRLIEKATGGKSFWVKAEIAAIKPASSGHTYLELVQTENGSTVAKAKANIWQGSQAVIKLELGADYDSILKEGSEVLLSVKVSFHLQYGYSLTVEAVDKDFALGDIEKRKRQCIEKLIAEGVIHRNKEIPLPTVIQQIIVIGSSESAGYKDFVKQIEENPYRYKFDHTLIHTQVQGDAARRDIVRALLKSKQIKTSGVIVILRGGGSKFDLDVFNDYEICKLITEQPLPVFTGLGHEIDQMVSDVVAHTSHKTPSAVGAYIISYNNHYEARQQQTWIRIKDIALRYYKLHHTWFASKKDVFSVKSIEYTRLRRGSLHTIGTRILRKSSEVINEQKKHLQKGHQIITLKPISILTVRETGVLRLHHQQLKQTTSKYFELQSKHLDGYNMRVFIRHAQSKLEVERRKIVYAHTMIQLADPEKISMRGFGIIRKGDKIVNREMILNQGDVLNVRVFGKNFDTQFIKYTSSWTLTQRMSQRLKSLIKF